MLPIYGWMLRVKNKKAFVMQLTVVGMNNLAFGFKKPVYNMSQKGQGGEVRGSGSTGASTAGGRKTTRPTGHGAGRVMA